MLLALERAMCACEATSNVNGENIHRKSETFVLEPNILTSCCSISIVQFIDGIVSVCCEAKEDTMYVVSGCKKRASSVPSTNLFVVIKIALHYVHARAE